MVAPYVKHTAVAWVVRRAHAKTNLGVSTSYHLYRYGQSRQRWISLVSWTQFTLYVNFFCVIDYPRIPQYSEKIKESASCLIWHMFEFLKLLYLTENKFCRLTNERPHGFSDVDNKFYSSIALRGCWAYFVTDWNSAISKFAWWASFSSRNMAAPYVKPTRQHNAAARLIRQARVPIVSLILLWKISLT